jgi:hypothetical protein
MFTIDASTKSRNAIAHNSAKVSLPRLVARNDGAAVDATMMEPPNEPGDAKRVSHWMSKARALP